MQHQKFTLCKSIDTTLRLTCETGRAGQVPHKKDRVPSSKFLEKKGTRSEELGPVQQKELGSSKFQVPSSFASLFRLMR